MKNLISLWVMCCFAVSVQAAESSKMTVEEILANTRYQRVAADPQPHIRGMSIAAVHPRGVLDDFSERYIRSRIDDDGRTHHQVILRVDYLGSWRFYRAAQVFGDESLPFKALNRRLSRCTSAFLGCDHSEVLSAELSRAQLERGMATGLVVRFESKKPGASTAVGFTPEYVQAYLIKLDGEEAVKPRDYAVVANR